MRSLCNRVRPPNTTHTREHARTQVQRWMQSPKSYETEDLVFIGLGLILTTSPIFLGRYTGAHTSCDTFVLASLCAVC